MSYKTYFYKLTYKVMKTLISIAILIVLAFVLSGTDTLNIPQEEIDFAENVEWCQNEIWRGYETVEQYERETGCNYNEANNY